MVRLIPLRICTALKPIVWKSRTMTVWFPYEFALLSNSLLSYTALLLVWFPYEFALLSNDLGISILVGFVWFPYEFALLSNTLSGYWYKYVFDSPTNLHCSQTCINTTSCRSSLIPLRICTALKHLHQGHLHKDRLIPLRICTALKRTASRVFFIHVWFPYEFALLSNANVLPI